MSPGWMCSTGGIAPEKTRWNSFGSKTCSRVRARRSYRDPRGLPFPFQVFDREVADHPVSLDRAAHGHWWPIFSRPLQLQPPVANPALQLQAPGRDGDPVSGRLHRHSLVIRLAVEIESQDPVAGQVRRSDARALERRRPHQREDDAQEWCLHGLPPPKSIDFANGHASVRAIRIGYRARQDTVPPARLAGCKRTLGDDGPLRALTCRLSAPEGSTRFAFTGHVFSEMEPARNVMHASQHFHGRLAVSVNESLFG